LKGEERRPWYYRAGAPKDAKPRGVKKEIGNERGENKPRLALEKEEGELRLDTQTSEDSLIERQEKYHLHPHESRKPSTEGGKYKNSAATEPFRPGTAC